MYATAGVDNKSMRLLNTAIFNCYVLGFAKIFPESNSVQTLQKSFG